MPSPKPSPAFDWPVYLDATLAGLALLTPVIFMDSLLEWYFRQRMPAAIAAHRQRPLPPAIIAELNRENMDWVLGCLLFPIWLVFQLLKRLSKKLLYFLTIKEATDQLSRYWHRAFLLDYALQAGHLTDEVSARRVRLAMEKVLQANPTSPVEQVAREIVRQTQDVTGALRRVRQGLEAPTLETPKKLMDAAWANLGQYWEALAQRYEAAYQSVALPKE